MVPVMSEWILQKKGYEPAALNVRLPVAPVARFSVVQVGSSVSVAVCGRVSLLVQVMTSPTLAWIVVGEKARPAIEAWTVPAAVEVAQAPAPASADAAGADAAGTGELATPVAGVEPPAQAARDRTAVMARAGNRRRDMASSSSRAESF